MRNIKLILEYDGTDFWGWQKQPEGRTVQGCMEDAFFKITQKRVNMTGSGRTDAGVHALGQVCNCFAETYLSNAEIARALNGVLPGDVVVKSVEDVGEDFHSRFNAKRRVYRYIISGHKRALFRRYMWHCPYPLELDRMQAAAEILRGNLDCSAFQAAGSDVENVFCTIYSARWEFRDGNLNFVIESNRFLRKMVRTIVGTMTDIGRGKIEPGIFGEILNSKDRARAGATAPPHGLFLEAVCY